MIIPLILSIDIGSSSVRAGVYDGVGEAVEPFAEQIPYAMTSTPDGGAFIELDTLTCLVFEVLDRICERLTQEHLDIDAVSMCTFWHSVVGIDENGQAPIPLLNWNDTRPESILPILRNQIAPEEFTQRTGCPFHASYLPAKITWVHQAMPAQAQKIRYWMSFGEYLLYRILQQRVCSISMASATGLLDSANGRWDERILQMIPATLDQLSPLQPTHHGLHGMQPEFQNRWKPLRNAQWFPALGDGACSNVGCGCASPERVTIMVGTSGAMRTIWKGDYQQPPSGLWCYRIDANRPIQGGALSNGGNLFAWMEQTLQLPPLDQLNDLLHDSPPDGHGLTVLPFFAGQRSPNWNADSTATIHGLRTATQPIDILQAGLEAVAYRFAMIHDRLKPLLSDNHIVVASGGGLLHSSAWTQMMADVIGRDVHISTVSEASCRGAALCALEALGVIEDITAPDPHFGGIFTPDPTAHSIYQKARQRHLDLENLLTEHPKNIM
jgi:gluconokinase